MGTVAEKRAAPGWAGQEDKEDTADMGVGRGKVDTAETGFPHLVVEDMAVPEDTPGWADSADTADWIGSSEQFS